MTAAGQKQTLCCAAEARLIDLAALAWQGPGRHGSQQHNQDRRCTREGQ